MTAWADEPLDDNEFPDEDDLGDDSDEVLGALVPCPNCGRAIWEGVQQCPECHEWILDRATWRSSRKWYVRGGLWAARTLLVNWLFWIGAAALVAVALVIGRR